MLLLFLVALYNLLDCVNSDWLLSISDTKFFVDRFPFFHNFYLLLVLVPSNLCMCMNFKIASFCSFLRYMCVS